MKRSGSVTLPRKISKDLQEVFFMIVGGNLD